MYLLIILGEYRFNQGRFQLIKLDKTEYSSADFSQIKGLGNYTEKAEQNYL